MKFEFATLDTVIEADWPVTVNVPGEGGKVVPQTFTVRFRMLDDAEILQSAEQEVPAKDMLRKVVVGLGKDEETAFSPEFLERLISKTYIRNGLMAAFAEFNGGIAAKNSRKPPA